MKIPSLRAIPSRSATAIEREFIDAIQQTAREVGALVILDEVISFRLAPGGGQDLFGIEPDLTALAKIIGGGFPVAALMAKDAVCEFEAGDQGGTYGGQPLAMAAAQAS